MIIRKVAAALAARFSVMVKPYSEAPLSVLMHADLAMMASILNAILNVILKIGHLVHAVGSQAYPIMVAFLKRLPDLRHVGAYSMYKDA
jgi:acyl-CoA reductase-like NAD-dependent aldehyde dehydrogenase